ncbi:MAG: hypothetical protein EXR09_04810 [Acetobacteraceae bacterium]|nr:hypothetical protein [Acetobacteraceae bacterium]
MLESATQRPAVVVHGLADVALACAPGLTLTLLSAPAAAIFAGPGWWLALIGLAQTRFPGLIAADLLDCGDAPGLALAALRLDQRTLILDPACPAFGAVRATAAALGGRVWPTRPASLDLAEPGAARRLAAWLSHRAGRIDPHRP